jgi:nuclear transport factor 2 (NTF2) superfamily protein
VDLFNYDYRDDSISGGTSYGQENWGSVTCDDLDLCVRSALMRAKCIIKCLSVGRPLTPLRL